MRDLAYGGAASVARDAKDSDSKKAERLGGRGKKSTLVFGGDSRQTRFGR